MDFPWWEIAVVLVLAYAVFLFVKKTVMLGVLLLIGAAVLYVVASQQGWAFS